MTTQINFRLDLAPMPTPRPRTRVIAVPGRKPIATIYSPKEYKDWQTTALRLLKQVDAPSEPFAGPLTVFVRCVAERPKTTKLVLPKPDVDNYVKGVLDAITTDGRFWGDDTQVAILCASKVWSSPTEEVGITVDIVPMTPKEL